MRSNISFTEWSESLADKSDVAGSDRKQTETDYRRIFARFGKIISFKLVNSPKFETNLAYVAYKHPEQAALALEMIPEVP